MHYAGARYYMSALGRWNGPDPLASSYPNLSPYNYVGNNPVNANDPTGMATNVIAVRGDGRGGIILEEGDTFTDLLVFLDYDRQRARQIWSYAHGAGALAEDDGGYRFVVSEHHISTMDLLLIDVVKGSFIGDVLMPAKTGFKIAGLAFLGKTTAQKLRVLKNLMGYNRGRLLQLVHNEKLRNTIKELYRLPDTKPGGSVGALLDEMVGKVPSGNEKHYQKVAERIDNLQDILKNQPLNDAERDIAQSLLIYLQEGLKGR